MLYEEAKQRLAKNPLQKNTTKRSIKTTSRSRRPMQSYWQRKKLTKKRIKELYSTIAKLEEKIKMEQKDLAAEHENEDTVRS